MNSVSPISQFGGLDALARLQPAGTPPTAAAVGTTSRHWFDAGHASDTLLGEVEAGAQGLGVSQHADRILGLLMNDDPHGAF